MVALRAQQILGHETGVANTVDPLAGSYYVEALTDQIEAGAIAYMQRIDELGGMLVATEQGWVQGEIAEAAYRATCCSDWPRPGCIARSLRARSSTRSLATS